MTSETTRAPVPRTAVAAAVALLVATAAAPAVQSHPGTLPGREDHETDAGFWNQVHGMATKTGFRLVFSWDADLPVDAHVEWGTDSTNLDQVARPVTQTPDTAGIAIVDVPDDTVGETIHYRVVDDLTGTETAVRSFQATNGWTTDGSDGVHEIDLLVQLDSQALPSEVPVDQGLQDLVNGADVAAERVWDASDEHVRVDDVLVTDTTLNYPANVPYGAVGCAETGPVDGRHAGHTVADVLVESSLPLDSHTFRGAMDDPCTGIYMGRLGQLFIRWGGSGGGTAFVHFGEILAHELGHYAMDLPDLYPGPNNAVSSADCWNGTAGQPGVGSNHDISMMHTDFGYDGSRWRGSEIDRGPGVTDCDYGDEPASWPILADLYPGVPNVTELQESGDATPVHSDSDHTKAVGNPDSPGGAGGYGAYVLDSEAAGSSLRAESGASGTSGNGPTDLPDVLPDAGSLLP